MMQSQQTQPVQTQDRTAGDRFRRHPISMNMALDLVGGTSFGRYPKISNEATYNMIISDDTLVDFAGHEIVKNITQNGNAREVYNSVLFQHIIAVIYDGVYIISQDYTVTKVGSLATQFGNVYIADNLASQIAIVDGLYVYIYNYDTSTFQQITVDFKPVSIAYQDTYFICGDGDRNEWRLSLNNDGRTWPADAQHVGKLESKPCKTVACIPQDRLLLVMGETVTEPWYDIGAQLFPYQRSSSYCIDYGVVSSQTIATGFGMIVWLGSNQQSGFAIMVSEGGGVPQPISNDGLDYLFSQLRNPEQSYGMLYKIEGHIIYHFTFTEDNYSFIYDFKTSMLFTVTDENLNHHIARRVVFFNNANHFISFRDGNLYKMASTITSYNGESIPRIRIPKNIRFLGADRFVVKNINLTMESGQNLSGALPANPEDRLNNVSFGANRIDLSLSDDGGYSYGNILSKSLPKKGQRSSSTNFWNLGGHSNDLVLKFRFISEGRFVVSGGTLSLYR